MFICIHYLYWNVCARVYVDVLMEAKTGLSDLSYHTLPCSFEVGFLIELGA